MEHGQIGSSWNKVISGLWSAGVRVVAPPLPLTSLQDDVAALDRTLERVGGPVRKAPWLSARRRGPSMMVESQSEAARKVPELPLAR